MISALTGNCAAYVGTVPGTGVLCASCEDGYGVDEASTCSTYQLMFYLNILLTNRQTENKSIFTHTHYTYTLPPYTKNRNEKGSGLMKKIC